MNNQLGVDVSTRLGRRDLLRVGGLTVSLGAIAAACGTTSTGGSAPGRVGNAPPITSPADYPVDDAVLLRTATSLEQSTIMVYEAVLDLGVLDADRTKLFERLVKNHRATDQVMADLTVAAGGEVWPCANPWMEERFLVPVVDAIKGSDNQLRDIYNVAVSFENLGAATYQQFSIELTEVEQRTAVIEAAAQDSRQSARLVIAVDGSDGYVSPALFGLELGTDADGVPLQYAIPSRFGSIAQFQLIVGAPNDTGTRESFTVQTPAANSYIYNELEPTC